MAIDNEYKEFLCVKNLSTNLKEKFNSIVDAYADRLSERIVMNDSVYTLHDFNHHCMDIYHIISSNILDDRTAYNKDHGLSDRELFILNLAVLFHDYSMFNSLDATRKNHSRKSAEFIRKEYDDSRSSFRRICDLSEEEVKALMAIIEAHSNVKDGTVKDDENGINSPNLKKYTSRGQKPIRADFLAGVLRLADELDITSARLGDAILETQLVELDKDIKSGNVDNKYQKYDVMLESLHFWKLQHYFSFLELKNNGDLCLHIDKEYIQKIMKEGERIDDIRYNINTAYTKICKEYDEISKKVFLNRDVSIYLAVKNISLEELSI